jgi:aspartyl-tRNA(Asn)/glutamyl-tRNA(Gln) amidotransferase subunit B
VLEGGGTILQETRHWEPAAKRTVTMRVKETADDYRLFPEPDLAPYDLSDEFIEGVRARLPELPDAKKRRYTADFGLPATDAANLAGDVELSAFFDEAARLQPALAKPIANLLLNDVAAGINAGTVTLAGTGTVAVSGTTGTVTLDSGTVTLAVAGSLTPRDIAELALLVAEDTISSRQAKEVFALMVKTGAPPAAIVEEQGMRQVSDEGAIESIVEQVLAANPEKVAEYRGGKTGLLGFFVGQAMRATSGQGNPKLINEALRKLLDN